MKHLKPRFQVPPDFTEVNICINVSLYTTNRGFACLRSTRNSRKRRQNETTGAAESFASFLIEGLSFVYDDDDDDDDDDDGLWFWSMMMTYVYLRSLNINHHHSRTFTYVFVSWFLMIYVEWPTCCISNLPPICSKVWCRGMSWLLGSREWARKFFFFCGKASDKASH